MWSYIQNIKGKTLKTLEKGHPFDVVSVGSENVTVKPRASGIERTVAREAFEHAFAELSARGELSRADIQKRYASSILLMSPPCSPKSQA